MKVSLLLLIAGAVCSGVNILYAQEAKDYWNSRTMLIPYRLPPAPVGYDPEYIDLDGDGDPDVLRTVTAGNVPVQWIDDGDDMPAGALEGDLDNDCLMIDRNRDGEYGGYGDLIVDWVGKDRAGNPAMQVVVDIPEKNRLNYGSGHYMWVIDTDNDNVFNYIDWNTFTLRCWIHNGTSDFFEDYNGKSTFLKIHSSPDRINDLRMNWENPFLFYDPDKDGLTEQAIRFCDTPKVVKCVHSLLMRLSARRGCVHKERICSRRNGLLYAVSCSGIWRVLSVPDRSLTGCRGYIFRLSPRGRRR